MNKKIVILTVLVVIVLVGAWYASSLQIYINSNTISAINGDLGANKDQIAYEWQTLPPKIKIGDMVMIDYKDGVYNLSSQCQIQYASSLAAYYCQAQWPYAASHTHGERENQNFYQVANYRMDVPLSSMDAFKNMFGAR